MDYATADGSAGQPGDYTATSGTLTFAGTDGESYNITVPNVDTTSGRVKVKGSGNIFFDVNEVDITVSSVVDPPGDCGETIHVGNLRFGVAAADNATGTGYLM